MSSKSRRLYISNYSEWINQQINILNSGDIKDIDIDGLIETLYLAKENKYIEAHKTLTTLWELFFYNRNASDSHVQQTLKRLHGTIDPTIFSLLKDNHHIIYIQTFRDTFGYIPPEGLMLPMTLERLIHL
jgi:hypothetical protein